MLILTWLLFCYLVANFAKKRGQNFWMFFAISAFLSPIGGLIAALILGKKQEPQNNYYQQPSRPAQQSQFVSSPQQNNNVSVIFCPECGEKVLSHLGKCPHCGASLK